jgi:hypothetical protein
MTTQYLHESLGLTTDQTLGLSHVGRLPLAVVRDLAIRLNIDQDGCHLTSSEGWKPEATDFEHHPNEKSGLSNECAVSWHRNDLPISLEFLEPLIPGISSIDNLSAGQMICDYVGVHRDTHMHDTYEVGALCILLDAPKGCRVLSNGKHLTKLRRGDVFVVDDSLFHAVYPERKTTRYNRDVFAQYEEKAIKFGRANCMKFLLITRELNQQGKR